MSGLERLLRPKSIAAIGGLQAGRVVEQCRLMGYQGEIWPVHPTKKEVEGLPAYASVADLPGSPDAAFIGVNRHLTIGVVRDLRAKQCGGAICYASGFLEADEAGAQLQSELIEASGDMPVLGPNCYGLINYADGALLWPDQQGGKRLPPDQTGVAIIAQSSNIAINFTMQQRGLPLAFILTAGNQALVGTSELALTILEDPRVTALGLYVEGFDSIESMETLAEKSRALNKPVVVYKVGKSEHSQIAAMTHTASLAGSHNITSAFLKRNGFGQAESIPVFLETLKLLHLHGPLNGYRISSMSCSGGEASIIADAADGRKVYFDELTSEQKAPIEAALGPLVTVANPLDYHTYCWGNREVMQAAYSGMVSNDFDLNYLILDFPHRDRCEDWEWMIAVDAFDAALKENNAKGAFVVGMPENISEDYTEAFSARGIVSFYGIDEALKATEIAADIGLAWQMELPPPVSKLSTIGDDRKTLDEAEAKQQLSAYGVNVPRGERLWSAEQGKELAQRLGYPVVLKALGIAHKTEHNAVRLNLCHADEVEQAANQLFDLSPTLYMESMVSDAVAELIVGISRDPQFGLVLTIGSGGILVEILKDAQTLLIPASREQIETAVLDLKSAPLLNGYRGKPGADLNAAIDAIISIQNYALSHSHELVELDVNPLLLCAEGTGVFAADALIVLEEKE
ncbi:MAG: acetate--CoA ligase family protein [Gammaproteobacteria bacterium]|nr:acetate--CoA ligase family protein [Gammaproteobacteria bacterium]